MDEKRERRQSRWNKKRKWSVEELRKLRPLDAIRLYYLQHFNYSRTEVVSDPMVDYPIYRFRFGTLDGKPKKGYMVE